MAFINELSSLKESRFEPLHHYGPVTALKIHKQFILAGYGPILKIFDSSKDFSLIFDSQIFGRNKIHAIAISEEGKIFASGGRSFAILDFASLEDVPSQKVEHAINEWIVCGEFVDEETLLVLTAHNIIYKVDTTSFNLVEQVHCNEKSILYSGSIRKTKAGRILIAAGTVMSGVLIWDYETREILYNLTEHEGSIFGVKIDENADYIVSCSDDRSIKLYDFHSGKLLSTGWGHGSRIWNLEFCSKTSASEKSVRLFSTGEDCTARLWEYQDGEDILKLNKVMDCHLGKHVWSGDIDTKSLELCVTGGADGRIIVHDISPEATLKTTKYEVDDITKQTSTKFAKNELVKSFCELPKLDIMVILTSHGQIFQLNQTSGEWSKLDVPKSTEKLVGFGLMKCFTDANVVVVTSRNGDLLTLTFGDNPRELSTSWIEDEHLQGNKVANIISGSNISKNEYYVLLDCPNPKSPLIFRTFEIEEQEGKTNFQLKTTTLLKQPEQSSFTTTCMWIDEVNNWLLLGSRYVSIAIYDLSRKESDDQPIGGKIFKKLSAGDTISSLSIINSRENNVRFLITVRDGVYMYLDIHRDGESFEVDIIHHNKISKGFVEGGFFSGNDLILYGFRSSYFYVFNESQQLEITNELCGGSHRQWEFLRYSNENGDSNALDFKFIYINKSALHIMQFKNRFRDIAGVCGGNIINYGTHGREIRDVSVSPFYEDESKNSRLIMTASEDTILRLGRIRSNGRIESLWCLNGHVSGLQKVKFFSKEFLASSAANEEFCIWKLNQTGDIPTIIEYARLKPSSSNPDLRVMDFAAIPNYQNGNESEGIIGFTICTVYSDSNIKIWNFDTSKKSFTLLVNGHYTTCCILNVHFLRVPMGDTYLMTGTTDGHLSVWNITSQLDDKVNTSLGKPIIKQQIHQSGVKATLILNENHENDSFKIVTGGDDNALILTTLTIGQNDTDTRLITDSFVEKAASATITSISKQSNSSIVVTSVDQVVRSWSIQEDATLTCESARYTTVADTGCSDSAQFDDNTIAVIGGAGLSTWKCK